MQMNAEGLVDAVITEDSDAFCYGAEVILRNFSISPSGTSVEMYTATRFAFK
jgi:flap endonuclease GEN